MHTHTLLIHVSTLKKPTEVHTCIHTNTHTRIHTHTLQAHGQVQLLISTTRILEQSCGVQIIAIVTIFQTTAPTIEVTFFKET